MRNSPIHLSPLVIGFFTVSIRYRESLQSQVDSEQGFAILTWVDVFHKQALNSYKLALKQSWIGTHGSWASAGQTKTWSIRDHPMRMLGVLSPQIFFPVFISKD